MDQISESHRVLTRVLSLSFPLYQCKSCAISDFSWIHLGPAQSRWGQCQIRFWNQVESSVLISNLIIIPLIILSLINSCKFKTITDNWHVTGGYIKDWLWSNSSNLKNHTQGKSSFRSLFCGFRTCWLAIYHQLLNTTSIPYTVYDILYLMCQK